GSSRRSRHIPTVVLPLPLSPTRPSVSPLSTSNETSSTARSGVCAKMPVRIAKLFLRLLTLRIGCSLMLILSIKQHACGRRVARDRDALRPDSGAAIERVLAAWVEATARRRRAKIGDRAANRRDVPALAEQRS